MFSLRSSLLLYTVSKNRDLNSYNDRSDHRGKSSHGNLGNHGHDRDSPGGRRSKWLARCSKVKMNHLVEILSGYLSYRLTNNAVDPECGVRNHVLPASVTSDLYSHRF